MKEFKPRPLVSATPQTTPTDPRGKKKGVQKDFPYGDPFRPDCVYDMLYKIKSNLSVKVRIVDSKSVAGYFREI